MVLRRRMKRCYAVILFAILASRGTAGESREEPCGAVKKAEAQTALEFDWIRMPLADADRLLRGKLEKAGEAKPLRAAVDEMIAARTAHRVDYTTLTLSDGDRSYVEAVGEELTGAEWKTHRDPAGNFSLRATATDLSTPGIQFVARADVSPDNQSAKVTLAVERMKTEGQLAWNVGKESVKLRATALTKCSRTIGMKTGEWTLQGVQQSWSVSKDAHRVEAPDCVLMMARATVQSPHPAVPDWHMPRQCLLFCEAIGTDPATAAALAARFQGPTGGDAMRQAMQEEIDKGTAMLEDIGVFTVMTGAAAKNESNCDFPAQKDKEPDTKEAARETFPFGITTCGCLQEAEANWITATSRWELSLTWSRTMPCGVAGPPAEGPAAISPGVRTLKSSSKLQLVPNTTVLAATLQDQSNPAKGGKSEVAENKRVTLLFLKLLE